MDGDGEEGVGEALWRRSGSSSIACASFHCSTRLRSGRFRSTRQPSSSTTSPPNSCSMQTDVTPRAVTSLPERFTLARNERAARPSHGI